MNNLTDLYLKIKSFADDHNMVNNFFVAQSEEDISNREFEYKQLIVIPQLANISREENSPVYSVEFSVAVLDRCIYGNDQSYITAVEENLFVIGQFQDYLSKQNYIVEFQDVELSTVQGEDFNIAGAICDFTVTLSRKPSLLDIDD